MQCFLLELEDGLRQTKPSREVLQAGEGEERCKSTQKVLARFSPCAVSWPVSPGVRVEPKVGTLILSSRGKV